MGKLYNCALTDCAGLVVAAGITGRRANLAVKYDKTMTFENMGSQYDQCCGPLPGLAMPVRHTMVA